MLRSPIEMMQGKIVTGNRSVARIHMFFLPYSASGTYSANNHGAATTVVVSKMQW
jgi:hypothetical protein